MERGLWRGRIVKDVKWLLKKLGNVSPDIAYSGNCRKFYEGTME